MPDASAATGGGATFTTLTLEHRDGVWAFLPTAASRLFGPGVIAGGFGFFGFAIHETGERPGLAVFYLLCGMLFVWFGALARAALHSGAVFDPRRREILCRRAAWTPWPWEPVEDFTLRFDEVSGVELRHKTLRIDNAHYPNTELSLLVRGGRRIALVAHTGADRLQREAGQLAALLGVPITDRRPGR